MKRLIIIGAGGHGKVIADIAMKTKKYSEIQFLDDNSSVKECMGFDVVGTTDAFEKRIELAEFFVAIGNNHTREIVINNINICDDCMIGAGAVVVKDLEKSGTYVGVPARKMKK